MRIIRVSVSVRVPDKTSPIDVGHRIEKAVRQEFYPESLKDVSVAPTDVQRVGRRPKTSGLYDGDSDEVIEVGDGRKEPE